MLTYASTGPLVSTTGNIFITTEPILATVSERITEPVKTNVRETTSSFYTTASSSSEIISTTNIYPTTSAELQSSTIISSTASRPLDTTGK